MDQQPQTSPPAAPAPDDWASAAQPAQPPPASTPAQTALAAGKNSDTSGLETQTPDNTAQIHSTAPPIVLRPQRTGLLGVVDKIADVLAGTTKPEIWTDDAGHKFVYHPYLTRGQQWERIGAEAAAGALKGLAAGKGAGNMGKAGAAGLDEGQQIAQQRQEQEKEMSAEERQSMLDSANNQMLRMQMAEQAWKFTRAKQQATREDVNFYQGQADRYVKEGGTVLGTAEHPGDIGKILQVNPDVMKDMVQKHQIEIVPHMNPDGKAGGIDVIKMPNGYRNNMLSPGAVFHTFDEATGKMIEHKSADPMTQGEIDDLEHSAGIAQMKYLNDQAEQGLKGEQKNTQQTEQGKNRAQTREANASADEHEAQAGQIRSEQSLVAGAQSAGGGTAALAALPAQLQTSIRGLTDYSVNPDTFPQRVNAKTGQMDRETAVGLARLYDPGYDEKEYPSRSKLRQSFTSGKDAQNITAINTAVQHLDELSRAASALSNTGTQPINAIKNWFVTHTSDDSRVTDFGKAANAVANEMATVFKGTGATDQEIKTWKEQLSSSQTPSQLRHGINEMITLMSGRLEALDNKWNQGMQRPRDFQILSPQSRTILQNLGASSLMHTDDAGYKGPAQPTPPQGATQVGHDAAGHVTGWMVDGKWVQAPGVH